MGESYLMPSNLQSSQTKATLYKVFTFYFKGGLIHCHPAHCHANKWTRSNLVARTEIVLRKPFFVCFKCVHFKKKNAGSSLRILVLSAVSSAGSKPEEKLFLALTINLVLWLSASLVCATLHMLKFTPRAMISRSSLTFAMLAVSLQPQNLQFCLEITTFLWIPTINLTSLGLNTSHKTCGRFFQLVWSIYFVFGLHASGPGWLRCCGMLNIISLKFIYRFDISKCPADQLEGMPPVGNGWALDHKAFVMGLKWCTWNTHLTLSADVLLLEQRQLGLHGWYPLVKKIKILGNLFQVWNEHFLFPGGNAIKLYREIFNKKKKNWVIIRFGFCWNCFPCPPENQPIHWSPL